MLIFNYGWNEVCNFFVLNVFFWFDKYYIDGFCVDVVVFMLYFDYSCEEGEWIFNKYGGCENFEVIDLFCEFNECVYVEYFGVMIIVEELIVWGGVFCLMYVGGLGFSFKWNMGWMNDMFCYMW